MVFILVALTVLLIIASEVISRHEEKRLELRKKGETSGIFIEPERNIRPIGNEGSRFYHPSHTWVAPHREKKSYVGFDNFITELFSGEVFLSHLIETGTEIQQGEKLWDIGLAERKVSQFSPVSGKILEINPAVAGKHALASDELGKSWIYKVETKDIKGERNNLVPHTQAMHINRMLSDELKWTAMQGRYLNDGGVLEDNFILHLSPEKWNKIVERFFRKSE